jgi:hypothetical protein
LKDQIGFTFLFESGLLAHCLRAGKMGRSIESAGDC